MTLWDFLKAPHKHQYGQLVLWIVGLLLMSGLMGVFTQSGLGSWYGALSRSPLTPPSYVFVIVWNILYIMIGISGWLIWQQKKGQGLKIIKQLYIGQLLLNWLWTPLFFVHHLVGAALVCLGMMIIVLSILMLRMQSVLPLPSVIFLPYLGWSFFAGYLNLYIFLYN